jgi:putative holliday junction resolvase
MMTVTTDIAAFRALLPGRIRLLGLDLGDRTIGIAMGSPETGIATPLLTIRRTRFQTDAAELMGLVKRERIDGLVLGLPLNMDGSAGRRVQATKAFARNLQAFAPPPILLFDERLSSAAAKDALVLAGVRRQQREAMIDAAAATVILQDALGALAKINPDD